MSGKKPRIVLITGDGKGKTTSAAGMALRFIAKQGKVLIARFCKTQTSGEIEVLARFDQVEIIASTRGMVPPRNHPDYPQHAAAAEQLFARLQRRAPEFDLLYLDEICVAVACGLLEENAVLEFLDQVGPEQTVILTGRNAGPGLLAKADTASEILCLKHGYRRGIAAERGVEY